MELEKRLEYLHVADKARINFMLITGA